MPVSARYADRIDENLLDGRPARVWESFLRDELGRGCRSFLLLPLFFGPSESLTNYIPRVADKLRAEYGDFKLHIAKPLVDPSEPEDNGLARLLVAQLDEKMNGVGWEGPARVLLVDHGSPFPEVTACRDRVADQMTKLLAGRVADVLPCSMERREGQFYDFNEPLLTNILNRLKPDREGEVLFLSYMFFFPGRHAGPGGDVDRICRGSPWTSRGGRLVYCPLVGESEGLVEMLEERFRQAVL